MGSGPGSRIIRTAVDWSGAGLILVDGTNVMHWDKSGSGVTLKHLLAVTGYLDGRGIDYKVLFDASSRHKLGDDERALFEQLIGTRPERFSQVPAQTRADDFLLMLADDEPGAKIVSNDVYRDYAARFPWVGDRARFIRGMVLGGRVLLLDGAGNRMKIPPGSGKSSVRDLI